MAGEELFKKYQTLIYLAGSASAEVFADIALCPFEAVKASKGRAWGCWAGARACQTDLGSRSKAGKTRER